MNIRHISFDFWNTLATPNKEFYKARLKYIQKILGIKQIGDVEKVCKEVQAFNINTSVDLNYYYIILKLCGDLPTEVIFEYIKQIKMEINNLFILYPPAIEPNVVMFLKGTEKTISIGSNTSRVPGSTILNYLNDTYKIQFDFSLFSDQLGFAKPDVKFFHLIRNKISWFPSQTIHVGDNKKLDGACIHSGIKFKHVKSPKELSKIITKL